MATRFEREASVSLHPMGITEGQTEPDVSIYTRNTTGSRGPKVNMDEVRKEAKSVSAILNGKDSNPVYQAFRAAKLGSSHSAITRILSLATRTHELRHVYDISLGENTNEDSAYFAELFLNDWQFAFVSQVNQVFDWNGSCFSAKSRALNFEHPMAFANVLGILAQELEDPDGDGWSKISDGPPASNNMPIEKIYRALSLLPDRTARLQKIYDKYFLGIK